MNCYIDYIGLAYGDGGYGAVLRGVAGKTKTPDGEKVRPFPKYRLNLWSSP